MKLIKNIILATDFSESSNNMVKNAIAFAKIFKSKITLIHVLPDDIKSEKVRLLLNDTVSKQLTEVEKNITNQGVEIAKPIIEYGNLSEKIIQLANNINANVILIGAGDKAENEAFQLGTTAEKIIRKSEKPVWVIKNNSSPTIKNILCPVDFSKASKRTLKNAIYLAQKLNAKLIIFNAYKINYPTALTSSKEWDEENERKKLDHHTDFDLFIKKFNLKDVNWVKEIKGGDPAAKIRKAISKHKIDLNIMGTSGIATLSSFLLGSVTKKVIREVPCSFITLKLKNLV